MPARIPDIPPVKAKTAGEESAGKGCPARHSERAQATMLTPRMKRSA